MGPFFGRILIDASELRRMLVEPDGLRTVVLDVAWSASGRPPGEGGCLPGAVGLDTDALEDGYPTWRIKPWPAFREEVGRHGVGAADRVVVAGADVVTTSRVAWALLASGAADVRWFPFGIEAWRAAGGDVASRLGSPTPAVFDPPLRLNLFATHDDVAALGGSGPPLLDVRSPAEFAGERSGYPYVTAVGRIPGAVHAGDAGAWGGPYLDAGGRLRPLPAIAAAWRAMGLDPVRDGAIFTCGGGWRSALTTLVALHLGAADARNHSEGWAGWSTDYTPDPSAGGGTPGWRQTPTGRPTARG